MAPDRQHRMAIAVAAGATAAWYVKRGMPSSVRTLYISAYRGEKLTAKLRRPRSDERLFNFTRLRRHTFKHLLEWLETEADLPLQGGRFVSAALKLIIFLYICAHNVRFWVVQENF